MPIAFVKPAEKVIQRVTLADMDVVLALEHRSSRSAGDFSRQIRTVVRHHKNMDLIVGIVLGKDTLYKTPDHRFLIPCGDKYRVVVIHRLPMRLRFFQKRHRDIDKLIGKTDEKHRADDAVEQIYDFRKNPS